MMKKMRIAITADTMPEISHVTNLKLAPFAPRQLVEVIGRMSVAVEIAAAFFRHCLHYKRGNLRGVGRAPLSYRCLAVHCYCAPRLLCHGAPCKFTLNFLNGKAFYSFL